MDAIFQTVYWIMTITTCHEPRQKGISVVLMQDAIGLNLATAMQETPMVVRLTKKGCQGTSVSTDTIFQATSLLLASRLLSEENR